jgi:hypothetical protein
MEEVPEGKKAGACSLQRLLLRYAFLTLALPAAVTP